MTVDEFLRAISDAEIAGVRIKSVEMDVKDVGELRASIVERYESTAPEPREGLSPIDDAQRSRPGFFGEFKGVSIYQV